MHSKKTITKLLFVLLVCSISKQARGVDWKWGQISAGFVIGSIGIPIIKTACGYFRKRGGLLKCEKIKDKSFEDFIGQSETVKQALDFVKTVGNRKECEEMGARGPRGLFIDGPETNGKSFLAKIIASELDAKMIEVNGDFFTAGGPLAGPMAFNSRVNAVFSFAKQKAKDELVVLFIDDLEQMFNVQLQDNFRVFNKKLEETIDTKNLIVIMATSDPGLAYQIYLGRAGIEKLHVPRPNIEGRKEILRYYIEDANKLKLSPEFSIEEACEKWVKQLSGARVGDLKYFVELAALIAFQRESEFVEREHFDKALLRLFVGARGNIIRSEKELMVAAAHEAGHALVAILCGILVKQLTIIPGEQTGGVAMFEMNHEFLLLHTKGELLRFIIAAFGGRCAEILTFGESTGGPIGDLYSANNNLLLMTGALGMGSGDIEAATLDCALSDKTKEKFDQSIIDLRKKCLNASMSLLENNKELLENLTNALLEKEFLSEEEISEIVGEPRDEVSELL